MMAAWGTLRNAATPRTWSRLLSVPTALGTGTVLAIARWLEPSPTGVETHLQLGLRPCTILTWTGWPCPMCGATTTFALLADFRVLDAIHNQPFAALLFTMTVAVFGISLAEVVSPKERWIRLLDWSEPYEGWLAVGFLTAMAAGWAYKAWLMFG